MAATEKNFRRLLALGTLKGRAPAPAAPGPAAADSGSGSDGDGGAGGAARSPSPPAGADDEADEPAGGKPTGILGLVKRKPRRTRLTKRNQQGVAVNVMVGGIAEMYLQHKDFERIKLLDRKGFVRIAVEHGADIVPLYTFGASQLLSFGPPWLMHLARRWRTSIGLLYGAWGTTVPHQARLRMAVGNPVSVGPPLPRSDPGFDAQVEKVHAEVVEAVREVYYRHREHYGWGDRELVIV